MSDQIVDFIIRGHEKVISHYRAMLSFSGVTHSERIAIQERLRSEEASLQKLIQTGESPTEFKKTFEGLRNYEQNT